MELKCKKKTLLFVVLVLAVLFSSVHRERVYAENQDIIGCKVQVEMIPEDGQLFNELNLNPGDYKYAKVTIKNPNTTPFELFMKAERLDETPSLGEPDLYQQLIVTVRFNGKVLYSGPLIDFASGKGISLGRFTPGEVKEMEVVVHLPGPETGNEFMGITHSNQWIFTAVCEAPNMKTSNEKKSILSDILPKTGTKATLISSILGLVFISMGSFGLYKRKRTKINKV